jgi:hypothetical protein
MRVRLFGQYVHISIAALAAIDAAIFFSAMLLAYRLRFGTWYPSDRDSIDTEVWLCASVFGAVNLVSVLAFGL